MKDVFLKMCSVIQGRCVWVLAMLIWMVGQIQEIGVITCGCIPRFALCKQFPSPQLRLHQHCVRQPPAQLLREHPIMVITIMMIYDIC